MIMDEETEIRLRRMLKSEGKSHEEINSIIKAFKLDERKEALDKEIEQAVSEAENEPIEETTEEESEPKKVSVLQIDESLVVSAISDALSKNNDEITAKKLEILGRIEEQLSAKLEQLNREIANVETEKAELKKLYEKAQIEFVNDRVKAREAYTRGLESFFGKVFETITNFSDSPTEQSLICLFTRSQGSSVVSLSGVLSSKKTLSKDDLKIGAD